MRIFSVSKGEREAAMPKLNPLHVEAVITAINRGPFFRHLSMSVSELGTGDAIVNIG